VLRYLETNKIAVYGTLWATRALRRRHVSRMHLPFTMYDNILYKYIAATGASPDYEPA